MPLIKLTASDGLSRVGRLNPWETASLLEMDLDSSLPGSADIIRVKERGRRGGVKDQLMFEEPGLQRKPGLAPFSSAPDLTGIFFPKT